MGIKKEVLFVGIILGLNTVSNNQNNKIKDPSSEDPNNKIKDPNNKIKDPNNKIKNQISEDPINKIKFPTW